MNYLKNKKEKEMVNMIVKIGSTYYNSTEEPILLILSKEEKSHIANMEENKNKYLSFPSDYNVNYPLP